jgi:hypothetical protein
MTSIFETTAIPNGRSWSIISKMADMLVKAEFKYGEKDKTYTVFGIELTDEEKPSIWYPSTGVKHIIIQITQNCLNDMNQAVFQVSHEIIHCLSSQKENKANVLEEGLATHFSIEYCRDSKHTVYPIKDKRYKKAQELVEQLLSIDTDIIKKVREIEPIISKISKDLLLKINPKITSKLAEILTMSFEDLQVED